jgi:tetratricopeptide (TPR) repeat protein
LKNYTSPFNYINLGAILFSMDKFDEAAQNYRAALRITPGNMVAVIGEANVYEKIGEHQRAYECLQPWLDGETTAVRVLPLASSLSLHNGETARFVSMMEALLEKNTTQPLPVEDLIPMHFSLGKVYDKLGEYDKAFAHYAQGNAIHPSDFNVKHNENHTQLIQKTYSANFLSSAPRATHGSQRPVFIVGMPRSGTSLVEQILASHSAIAGGGEQKGIKQIVDGIPTILGNQAGYPQCVDQLTEAHLNTFADRYLQQLTQLSADAVRVTDKMPHNFQHLGLIALLFPQARIIHCVRNPLDTCLSCFFQNFGDRHDYSFNLEHLAIHYRQYQQMMAHWKKVLNIPIMEVVYEEHVAEPERFARSLIEFCGLEWEAECLRFHESKRVVHTSSYEQVRRPIYTDSVQRWKHYEGHLEQLKRGLGLGEFSNA